MVRVSQFVPERDAILPVDDCWLVEARLLSRLGAGHEEISFDQAYARAIDRIAEQGYGCVPDPAAGDRSPDELVATCVVYRIAADEHVRSCDPERELHIRLVCTMARTDGAFVGSELAVALEVADRLAETTGERLRFRSIVHELFVNPAARVDPLTQVATMPRADAFDLVETLRVTAWADGLLRDAERRMLERVAEVLKLPPETVDPPGDHSRYVQSDAA